MPKTVWQAPYEAVQHRTVQFRNHNSGLAGRESNLLLVMPAFCQLAGSIEPVQRCIFTRPTDGKGSVREWVERFMELRGLFAGCRHDLNQEVGAQTAVDRNAFLVEAVDQGNHFLRRLRIDILRK